jgi:toxin ParE1/3/4
MAHRVVWSPRALADVDAIASYIASDSPFYAGSVVRRIIELTRALEKFPFSGRKVPEFEDENIRELIAYSYRIIYRVQAEEVIRCFGNSRETRSEE